MQTVLWGHGPPAVVPAWAGISGAARGTSSDGSSPRMALNTVQ